MDYLQTPSVRTVLSLFLMFSLAFLNKALGQSVKQQLQIQEKSNISMLKNIRSEMEADFSKRRARTLQLAKANDWKLKEVLPNGNVVELQDIGDDGSPIYYETFSNTAGTISRANTLYENGVLGLGLDGTAMTVGLWDAGVVRTSHREFGTRARVGDGTSTVDSHATLVAGALVSSGIRKEAKGAAYNAKVISHDWSRDKMEAAEAAANGLLLSNHSYGIKTDRVPDWYFGAYVTVAQDWDKIMYNAPYYLMVTAAGNAHNREDNESPIYGKSSDGYDILVGFTVAKNGLTVAAANSILDSNAKLVSAEASAYSSFGPVDDGRIKPDIAGDGSALLSAYSDADDSYQTSSGTSMAAPGVTGALLLLQQYNEQLYGSYLKAATLKGLALHTADDVHEEGPDYKMGWGIINAKKAAEVLMTKDYSSTLEESNLQEGQTTKFTVTASGNETLFASISWTDPESDYVNRGELNDPKPVLINDLDIRITQNGQTFLPWKLNPNFPEAAATREDNKVDPFERIEIPNASGVYTITVSHKGSLTNGNQDFSIIVSGIKMSECMTEAPKNVEINTAQANSITLGWEQNEEALYEVQYRKVSDSEWTTLYAQENSQSLENMEVGSKYTLRLRSFCSQNIASAYSPEYTFMFDGLATPLGVLNAYEALAMTEEVKLQVFPNPTVDEVHINTEVSDQAQYLVVATSGETIKAGNVKDGAISVSDLSTGLYVLQIQDNGMNKSAKFYKN